MNGVLNAFFIIILFMGLIAYDYLYTISDQITNAVYGRINAIEPNEISDAGFTAYEGTRDFLYALVTGIMVPFLLFLSFTSSFINRNQTMVVYVIQAIAILMVTPIMIFIFADVFTQMLSFSLLDSAYMATVYFNNFLQIFVVNMLLALASFVFVKEVPREYSG
jgi:hypothetical protein